MWMTTIPHFATNCDDDGLDLGYNAVDAHRMSIVTIVIVMIPN